MWRAAGRRRCRAGRRPRAASDVADAGSAVVRGSGPARGAGPAAAETYFAPDGWPAAGSPGNAFPVDIRPETSEPGGARCVASNGAALVARSGLSLIRCLEVVYLTLSAI